MLETRLSSLALMYVHRDKVIIYPFLFINKYLKLKSKNFPFKQKKHAIIYGTFLI